ncbi:MAG: cobyrinate a,c-diamide synthase [Gammaproteobacteria bacterium]
MKTALLAGTHSGCGKTTLMLALLQHFRQNAHEIISFKTGPDFIDPLWHQAITGRPSYNLDTRMMGAEACRAQLGRHAGRAEFALIEGVMGMFDGYSGVGGEGSSLDLARVAGCPVILAVDAGGMSGTIAAVVMGFNQLAEQNHVRIAGIIANRVGSEYHADLLRDALNAYQLPPLLGWMARSDTMLSERHLGLKMPTEADVPDYAGLLRVDDEALRQAFSDVVFTTPVAAGQPQLTGKTIAIARDQACCFIYPANLDWLQRHGAKRVFFSPMAGEPVPEDADAVWLPGGYPELYAEPLSLSASWVSLRECAETGMPILAECGGAMLLGKSLVDLEGRHWPMAAIFPYVSVMQPRLAALGYREEASGVKGHEFHYSTREQDEGLAPAFAVSKGDKGVRYRNVRASYVHWYFADEHPQVADWLSGDRPA